MCGMHGMDVKANDVSYMQCAQYETDEECHVFVNTQAAIHQPM